MNDIILSSATIGVVISLLAYELGAWMKKKFRSGIFNPLMISIVLTIVFLLAFGIEYENYNAGAKYLSYLLTPATVSLSIPLYMKLDLLKKYLWAILGGILSGVLSGMVCILALAAAFGLSHEQYVTLLPKSITTAIGIGIAEEYGGVAAITVAVIIITGVLGNMTAEFVCRTFGIKYAVSRGLAIGTASHAIGTGKAIEMGETEGAMSGLAIAVAGLMTVAAAGVFSAFL